MQDQPRVRFRATVQYDGSGYHGWQVQPETRTVQGELESKLEALVGGRERVLAAGRTDRGVHAMGQEVAFSAPSRWAEAEMRDALNATLSDEIRIGTLRRTDESFHPRFDATARRYEYLVGTTARAFSPLRRNRLWPLDATIDEDRLHEACDALVGERSFRAFAKSGQPQRGTRCRVDKAEWSRGGPGDLWFIIVANRFLHHMVRYLVSTMVEIGLGRRSPDELRRLLDGEEVRAPSPAPPTGLYLTGVRYPDGWNRPPGVPGCTRNDPRA